MIALSEFFHFFLFVSCQNLHMYDFFVSFNANNQGNGTLPKNDVNFLFKLV